MTYGITSLQLMKTKRELWRTLKVGDRVRMVEIPSPSGTFRDWMTMHAETRRAYRYLLQRKHPLTICRIDEYGFPWVKFQFRGRRGRMEYHSMALNHGGLKLVQRRRQ